MYFKCKRGTSPEADTNVTEVPNAKVWKRDDTIWATGSFLPDDQVIRVFKIFVDADSMTNSKVYQGFHDNKQFEGHRSKANTQHPVKNQQLVWSMQTCWSS